MLWARLLFVSSPGYCRAMVPHGLAAAGATGAAPAADLKLDVVERPFLGHSWVVWSHSHALNGKGPCSHLALSPLLSSPFDVGEVVAVDLKSNLKHCHASVLAASATAAVGVGAAGSHRDQESEVQGSGSHAARVLTLPHDELGASLCRRRRRRPQTHVSPTQDQEGIATPALGSTCRVQLHSDGSEKEVSSQRLSRVLPPSRPHIIIVHDTTSFRFLAKTQCGQGDGVLEVGSSLGECTRVIACHAGAHIGVDVVKDLVEETRARHPQCRFEWLDCFEEPWRLREYCEELAAQGTLKVFVDIGGDRTTTDVCSMLAAIAEATVGCPPALIAIKAKALAGAAAQVCDPDGHLRHADAFWRSTAAPPPAQAEATTGSLTQQKKKLARARKAKWNAATEEEWQAFQRTREKWENPEEHARLAAKVRELKREHEETWGAHFRSLLTEGDETLL